MENFLQFKSLGRVRDIRDQLAGLCERVEVVIESNPSSGDTVPIQKALTSGYFFNTVRRACLCCEDDFLLVACKGAYTQGRRVQDDEIESNGLHSPIFQSVPASTATAVHPVLRAGAHQQGIHATVHAY
jgi:hypothetical protein